MSGREATAQQTDPLGALNQRPISLALGAFAVLLAVWRTLTSPDADTRVAVAVVAIALLVVAAGILVVVSSPFRAPFTRRSFSAMMSAGLLAMIAEAVASAGHDVMIRDDWGATAIGLLLLAAAPFRPGRELVTATVVSAVCVGVVVFVEAPTFATDAPGLLFVAVGITPVLALGVGAAVYATTFVSLVDDWMARARELTLESAHEMRTGIARSVQQDRVTSLNRDVVPLFAELVERGTVTEADRERARQVATSIRMRIVAETDRSWLEQALLDVCPNGNGGRVVDRAHLADHMTTDQRTAVRALVNALGKDPATAASTLGVVLHDDEPLVRALIRVDNSSPDSTIRQQYAPYFAVLRILFHDLLVDVSGSFLTLRFSYDQH